MTQKGNEEMTEQQITEGAYELAMRLVDYIQACEVVEKKGYAVKPGSRLVNAVRHLPHLLGQHAEDAELDEIIFDYMIRVARDAVAGDTTGLRHVVKLLVEHRTAQDRLRSKGYGVIGMPLLDTVREVPPKS